MQIARRFLTLQLVRVCKKTLIPAYAFAPIFFVVKEMQFPGIPAFFSRQIYIGMPLQMMPHGTGTGLTGTHYYEPGKIGGFRPIVHQRIIGRGLKNYQQSPGRQPRK
jgi:hypothetical protein